MATRPITAAMAAHDLRGATTGVTPGLDIPRAIESIAAGFGRLATVGEFAHPALEQASSRNWNVVTFIDERAREHREGLLQNIRQLRPNENTLTRRTQLSKGHQQELIREVQHEVLETLRSITEGHQKFLAFAVEQLDPNLPNVFRNAVLSAVKSHAEIEKLIREVTSDTPLQNIDEVALALKNFAYRSASVLSKEYNLFSTVVRNLGVREVRYLASELGIETQDRPLSAIVEDLNTRGLGINNPILPQLIGRLRSMVQILDRTDFDAGAWGSLESHAIDGLAIAARHTGDITQVARYLLSGDPTRRLLTIDNLGLFGGTTNQAKEPEIVRAREKALQALQDCVFAELESDQRPENAERAVSAMGAFGSQAINRLCFILGALPENQKIVYSVTFQFRRMTEETLVPGALSSSADPEKREQVVSSLFALWKKSESNSTIRHDCLWTLLDVAHTDRRVIAMCQYLMNDPASRPQHEPLITKREYQIPNTWDEQ